MGCDVHPCIQVRNGEAPGGYWRSHIVPCSDRHYTFFGTLAGVRDKTLQAIHAQRGYPADCGEPAGEWQAPESLEGWCGGEHSASWFTLAEGKAYVWEYLSKFTQAQLIDMGCSPDAFTRLCAAWGDWLADMEYAKKYRWPEYSPATDDDVRVVFNFD